MFYRQRFSLVSILCLLLACQTQAPGTPRPNSIRWKVYENSIAGYSMIHPDVYTLEESHEGHTVKFSYGKKVAVAVHWASKDSENSDGLWFEHPVDRNVPFAGDTGDVYDYISYAGITGTRTRAYVIPRRGKYLGLEFKTDLVELNSVQAMTLSSFHLLD